MSNVSAILRAYDQRKAERKAVTKVGKAVTEPAPYDPLQDPDSAEFFAASLARVEAEIIYPDTNREPKSIHSPTQAARIRFSPPIPKGTGPQKRFSVNGW